MCIFQCVCSECGVFVVLVVYNDIRASGVVGSLGGVLKGGPVFGSYCGGVLTNIVHVVVCGIYNNAILVVYAFVCFVVRLL